MVSFDTVNHNISGKVDAEVELARYLDSAATDMGFATQRLSLDGESFNLLITHEVSPQAPWLLFESHMDTVTVEGMIIDPFVSEIRDGKIYGRGACDTKGTGAAMLWALKQYAAENNESNNIAIVFTTDEEIGKEGVSRFAAEQLPNLGWRPVGAIIGEPTMLKPVVAHNGVARWKISTKGVAAHSADPSKGRSAISMMMKVIDLIENTYTPSLTATHPLTGKAQCSVNVIRGGVQVNVIPESCEIHVDRRIVPEEDKQTVRPTVEKLLEELQQLNPGMAVELNEMILDSALDPTGNESLTQCVQGVLDKMGLPAQVKGVAYGTDAPQLSEVGVPAIVIGPGSIEQAHTKDEWLSLDQLDRGIEIYLNLMRADLKELS